MGFNSDFKGLKGEDWGFFLLFPSAFVLLPYILNTYCTKACALTCNGAGTIRGIWQTWHQLACFVSVGPVSRIY